MLLAELSKVLPRFVLIVVELAYLGTGVPWEMEVQMRRCCQILSNAFPYEYNRFFSDIHKRGMAFRQDESGAMAILTLFIFLFMLVMAGIGVDTMRHEMERAKLQSTLDGAVLAAASLQVDRDPQVVVQDYFDKSGYGSALNAMDASDYSVMINSRAVRASAAMDIETYLMKLSGVNTLGVSASSGAMEAVENVEVSLVLDISGSMRYGGRIDNLRPAAKDFVSTLLTGEAAQTTSINLIPYAGQTNPGPEMFAMLGGVRQGATGVDFFPELSKDTSNVVLYYDQVAGDEHPYDFAAKLQGFPGSDVSVFNKDDPDSYVLALDAFFKRNQPGLSHDAALIGASAKAGGTITPVYMLDGLLATFDPQNNGQVDAEANFTDFLAEVLPQISSCLEIETSDFLHTGLPNAGRYEQVPYFMNWTIDWGHMDWGWCPEDDTSIQYAQNDELSLHDFIDQMRLHDGTGTHYAMKYALATLDPSSRDAYAQLATEGLVPSSFADRPKAWDDSDVRKIIVLMTDGKITEQVRPTYPYDPINASLELKDQTSARTSDLSARSINAANFKESCDLAKARGVEVFTIAFETTSAGQAEMRDCASSIGHYFETSGNGIDQVFRTIARQITQLRLTQ